MSPCIVILGAMNYYRKRVQNTINKGKRCGGQSPGETRSKLSKWSGRGHPQPTQQQAVTARVRHCPPGVPVRDPVFTGPDHVSPLSVWHKARLQTSRRKAGISMNHIASANALGRVSHSYQRTVGTLPKSKFPEAS